MKISIMKQWLLAAGLACLLGCVGVSAQSQQLTPRATANRAAEEAQVGRLQMGDLDRLEAKAKQVVEVSIDHRLIGFLAKLLSDKKPEEAQLKQVILGLKGIYVRSYEFAEANSYNAADIEFVRRQVKMPLWSRIVGVRQAANNQNVEVYTMLGEGEQMNGLAIIANNEKSLTVVNVVGLIDLDKLRLLEGNFGVPKLQISDDKAKP